MNGEKLSVDEVEAILYCDELTDTMLDHGYCMDQIFSADETSLNYKMLLVRLAANVDKGSWSKEVQGMCDCYALMHLDNFDYLF